VALGHAQGLIIRHQEAPFEQVLGINTQRDLAHVAGLLQDQWRRRALDMGVTLMDPASTYLSFDTHLESPVTLYPHVFLDTGVRLQAGCVVYPFSVLAHTTVKAGAKVGPFCHLRGGCVVDEGSTVGNFVEMKKTHLGPGASAKHLSYLGDATIWAQANIGAGTITCNYDGTYKHPTTIGAGAFVGSNTSLVAPVAIGDGARIGAGSVITQDIPAHHLGLSRAPQENRPPRPSPPQREDS
jgi:bifunctional UDP-N-acetylglucosamine pyrophosphorylase/glucosamine-1-phosphate N-acetyltransferase